MNQLFLRRKTAQDIFITRFEDPNETTTWYRKNGGAWSGFSDRWSWAYPCISKLTLSATETDALDGELILQGTSSVLGQCFRIQYVEGLADASSFSLESARGAAVSTADGSEPETFEITVSGNVATQAGNKENFYQGQRVVVMDSQISKPAVSAKIVKSSQVDATKTKLIVETPARPPKVGETLSAYQTVLNDAKTKAKARISAGSQVVVKP